MSDHRIPGLIKKINNLERENKILKNAVLHVMKKSGITKNDLSVDISSLLKELENTIK